jgi:DNA-binding NarL/FixJ family response regulator
MKATELHSAGKHQPQVRVLIVDDHPLVRRTIRRFLESERGFEVVAEAGTCAEAHEAMAEHHPDIVLLDLELGEDNGFRVLDELRDAKTKVPVLVVSLHSESIYAPRCIEAGAGGFLMKSDAPDHLVGAIRCILDGGVYLSRNMNSFVVHT